MKTISIFLLFLSLSVFSFAQSSIEDIVREGIGYHDAGDFDKAIETYKKALKIDPKSTLVNYEISLSYLRKEDYKNAVKYANKVLKQKEDHMTSAYVAKGTALDMMGKTQQSIELFEEAIAGGDTHYLIYYNLAINHLKIKNLDQAEPNLIEAINSNPSHASSHYQLARINHWRDNPVQSVLASHFFLLIEPDTDRSKEVFKMMKYHMGGKVTRDENNAKNLTITLNPNADSAFSAAELTLSILSLSDDLAKDALEELDLDGEIVGADAFTRNTQSLITVLEETADKGRDEIWWNLYIPTLQEIATSGHLEAYCHYIRLGNEEESVKWLEENEDKLDAFIKWINEE